MTGFGVIDKISKLNADDLSRELIARGSDFCTARASLRSSMNQIPGCITRVWVDSSFDPISGSVSLYADADSAVARGICSVLVDALSGMLPSQILHVNASHVSRLLDKGVRVDSRGNLAKVIIEAMQAKVFCASPLGRGMSNFPSLIVKAGGSVIEAEGEFARLQSRFFGSDPAAVGALRQTLAEKRIGVVAHFYMDPEVQGVLMRAKEGWEHIHISDSLAMAGKACEMAAAGCTTICVLGVDFMSENIRAMLDNAGFAEVPVFRMDARNIGCSLAEAAESIQYSRYLVEGIQGGRPALHVIYINTSLESKAAAQSIVPTICCTSSNVVQTCLEAFAESPDVSLLYGPDTYMGRNLRSYFYRLAQCSDEEVGQVHRRHTAESVKSFLPHFHAFDEGTCMVHDMFGAAVCERIAQAYSNAYVAAHFEVPGEMFELAIEAQQRGLGCVGSTSNIKSFIEERISEVTTTGVGGRLRFILGTETGMSSSIVDSAKILLAGDTTGTEIEIIYPVNPDSIALIGETNNPRSEEFDVVPGPASGEGCSSVGGCASCPYMKMNSLQQLQYVCDRIRSDEEVHLNEFKALLSWSSSNVVQLGTESIMYMNEFMKDGHFPHLLMSKIQIRGNSEGC